MIGERIPDETTILNYREWYRHDRPGECTLILPGDTRPELDTFLRLQDEGTEFEEAYQYCLAEQGQDFLDACEVAEKGRAPLTHDTLVEFTALSQKGFARTPRELLVVAKCPDYVSAFLVSNRLLQ